MDFEEQKLALDTLYYEIWMLNQGSMQGNYVLVPAARCVIENNILIESFLIHARNLIYFLGDKLNKKDIRCSDFGVDKIDIDLPIGNNEDKISKFLSHLSKKRLDWEKPKWNCDKIREEINKGLISFLDKIDQNLFPTKENKCREDFDMLFG